MTRRWRDNSLLVQSVRLFLIDEVSIAFSKHCLSDSNEIRIHNHLVRKQTRNHLAKLTKWLSCVVSTYLYGAFDCMLLVMLRTSLKVNPHSIICLNVKKLLARSRRHIWSLSDSNEIQIHNHLVHKRSLNHLAKLVKWLSCVVSTYLHGAFDCILLIMSRTSFSVNPHSNPQPLGL